MGNRVWTLWTLWTVPNLDEKPKKHIVMHNAGSYFILIFVLLLWMKLKQKQNKILILLYNLKKCEIDLELKFSLKQWKQMSKQTNRKPIKKLDEKRGILEMRNFLLWFLCESWIVFFFFNPKTTASQLFHRLELSNLCNRMLLEWIFVTNA